MTEPDDIFTLPREPRQSYWKPLSDSGFLWQGYIGSALIPIAGVILAVYVAVVQRYAHLRRHAIGFLAAAILGGIAWAAVAVAVSRGGAANASAVQSDVSNLLLDKLSVLPDSVTCVHQVGNEYVCQVSYQGKQQSIQVTDDGNSVFEQGFVAPGGGP